MNLNTDLVNHKAFELPICSKIQNLSQEYRVLATLRFLYPGKYDSMIKAEAPDLQDVNNGVGIEVTVAVREKDMEASRALLELCQHESVSKKDSKGIIEKCGYSLVQMNDSGFMISTLGTSGGEYAVFRRNMINKSKKLPRYRSLFNNVGLAILLQEIPTTFAENNIPKWISKLNGTETEKYDFIYVISHRFCIYFDALANITEKKPLTQNETRLLSTIGRMTAEGELSLDSIEWR